MSKALQWLRTSGPDVVAPDGTPVRLRGVGIGGWLNMENFYRRAVAAIRAVDGRHIVFLDGNTHAREFRGFGEPFENAVYAIHQYPEPGAAGGGPYPGITGGSYVDRHAVESEFLSMTGYMRERELPVWVGEFGPVYGAGPERDAQRRRLLADQIGTYEAAGAGWSRDVLEPLIGRFWREFPGYDPYPFGARRYVEQLVLSICFAEPLAGEFAACFADASDQELIALGQSFSFGACAEQKDLREVVARHPPGDDRP